MSDPDELYTLRNLFWLGSYQMAINEANSLTRLNPALNQEKEEFVYRSYLAMGQSSVIINEVKITSNISSSLKALRILAASQIDPTNKDSSKQQLSDLFKIEKQNSTLNVIAAIYAICEGDIKEAIGYLNNESSLEQCALLVQLYLRMDRLDLAQKVVKSMKSIDEDSVLSMLSNAWTCLYMGGAKAQEASFVFDELVDKYGASAALLNGLAISKMQQGNFEEAETHLLEALTKAPMDADTIANLICVSQHLGRSIDITTRYLGQLKSKCPTHSLLTSMATFEGAYDHVATTLSR